VPALYVLFQTLREKGNLFRLRNSQSHLWMLLLLFPMLFGGCASVGPDYEAPELPAIQGATTNTVDITEWWNQFNDPVLTEMVLRALENNLDLKTAVARVRQARAELGRSRAAFGPSVNLGGQVTEVRSSDNVDDRGTQTLYRGGFDAVWEIDVFGGTRRAVEAAVADFEAQQYGLAAVQVSVVSETARAYLLLRTFQYRVVVAQSNLRTQKDTVEILESRRSAGLSNGLAVQQARYNYERTRSVLPALEAGLESSYTALSVLIGEMPGLLELVSRTGVPHTDLNLIGIPADVLRRRPDIRQAERELAAQSARVGVSVADLYPKFSLTGSIGLESLKGSNFFDSDSGGYSIVPKVRWPIFSSGSIRNNIKVQEAILEQYLAAYESTVLHAVKEVRDALVDYRKEQERREALERAVEAALSAQELSADQYRNGLSDFNNVLDAQRSLLGFQEQLAVSEGAVSENAVRLYKALGGGWQPME
jgi:NodT family efflux transporter outer membrane factor (OMF) lipoprotein